jgi:hypothetical protein
MLFSETDDAGPPRPVTVRKAVRVIKNGTVAPRTIKAPIAIATIEYRRRFTAVGDDIFAAMAFGAHLAGIAELPISPL